MKKIIFCIVSILAAAAVITALIIGGKTVKVMPEAEFTVKIKGESIVEFVEEKSRISLGKLIGDFIPEEITLSCRAEFTGEEKAPVRLTKLYVNGYEIPRELYENFLDFSGALVYN